MKIDAQTRGIWVVEGDNSVFIPAEDSSSEAAAFLQKVRLVLEIGSAVMELIEKLIETKRARHV